MLKPVMKSLRVSATQIFSKILKSSLLFGKTPRAMISLALSSAIASGNLLVDKVFDQELRTKSKHQELIAQQNRKMK